MHKKHMFYVRKRHAIRRVYYFQRSGKALARNRRADTRGINSLLRTDVPSCTIDELI
jgi:hypothetical protein